MVSQLLSNMHMQCYTCAMLEFTVLLWVNESTLYFTFFILGFQLDLRR